MGKILKKNKKIFRRIVFKTLKIIGKILRKFYSNGSSYSSRMKNLNKYIFSRILAVSNFAKHDGFLATRFAHLRKGLNKIKKKKIISLTILSTRDLKYVEIKL